MQNTAGACERVQQHADKCSASADFTQEERRCEEYLAMSGKITDGSQSGGGERRIGEQGSSVSSKQQHCAQQQECEQCTACAESARHACGQLGLRQR